MTTPLDSADFVITAPGVDAAAMVREISGTVARKTAEGFYSDAVISRAERHNLVNLTDSREMLEFYLSTLTHSVGVDISDYTIRDRRGGLAGKLLVKFKTVIWKLLKFYTYRLWSQQQQVNGLIATAVECSSKHYQNQIARLERRIADLEQRQGPPA